MALAVTDTPTDRQTLHYQYIDHIQTTPLSNRVLGMNSLQRRSDTIFGCHLPWWHSPDSISACPLLFSDLHNEIKLKTTISGYLTHLMVLASVDSWWPLSFEHCYVIRQTLQVI